MYRLWVGIDVSKDLFSAADIISKKRKGDNAPLLFRVYVAAPFSVKMVDPSAPFILRYVLVFQFPCSSAPQLPQAGSGERYLRTK
jgi:hypothetical protein